MSEKSKEYKELLKEAVELYEKEFKHSPNVGAKAPGRVNIIGEHTDYNFGLVLPMTIPLYTIIVGKKNDDSDQIEIITSGDVNEEKKATFERPTENKRLEQGTPKWCNYVKGVIEHFPHDVPGFKAVIFSSVPLGSGLSSSASLEVSICTFLESLTEKTLELREKALLCQKAEHTFANMPCGIMDQFISTFGQENTALLIDCQSLGTKRVSLTKSNEKVAFIVANCNVRHELSGSEYPERRSDCFKAAEILGLKSLREATMSKLRENRDKLGERVYQRALHVVSEIERCIKASEAMEDGDFVALGRYMYQSHVSLRDLYEVSCKELDELVDISMKCEGVYGARMTGGGFGGCIVALVKESAVDNVIKEIHKNYSKEATCYNFKPVQGAGVVKI